MGLESKVKKNFNRFARTASGLLLALGLNTGVSVSAPCEGVKPEWRVACYEEIAEEEYEEGNFRNAIIYADKVLSVEPERKGATLAKGKSYLELGNFTASIEAYDAYLKASGRRIIDGKIDLESETSETIIHLPEILYHKGRSIFESGDDKGTIQAFMNALLADDKQQEIFDKKPKLKQYAHTPVNTRRIEKYLNEDYKKYSEENRLDKASLIANVLRLYKKQ